MLASSCINYLAVASAGFLNSYCMRMSEMKQGIAIYNEDEEYIGISKKSAEKAVIQTALSRTILPMPVFFIPGISMFLLDKMGLIPSAKVPKTILELSVLAVALWVALPLSVSLFPQKGEISVNDVEPEFRNIMSTKGTVC